MANRLKIGITVVGGETNPQAAMWSYGIGQNVAYLAFLFQRMAGVEQVVLVAGPPGGGNVLGDMFGLDVVQLEDAVDRLDLIIELGSRALTPEQAQRLRSHGGRLVSYMAGNAAVNNFQALVNEADDGGDMPILGGFDAVWITPQNWFASAGHARIVRSERVRKAPHIWSPYCLQTAMMKDGGPAYWRPRDGAPAKLGVFEPNLNVTKTFQIPLLAAEEAYRKDKSLIDTLLLFNTYHLRDNAHVTSLRDSLELGKDKKIFFEHLHPIAKVMGKHVNVVLSHQWELNLNYLYWDIMYLGWPLVHSSDAVSEYGYYYPSFDPQTGGEAVTEAIRTHDENIDRYRNRTNEVLWQFSIENPVVIANYKALVDELFDTPELK
ncbi:DUF2827 family protein [Brevundimonas sp. TWP2-3-4b2]|uniref:DUF2827 family protein n=1 Tax=Brevundimonas sp. TWP2-3-4b2 TaxID=2804595 RepID=UPI003CE6C1EA